MKAFVTESGREVVLHLLDEASVSATSRLSYVECRTAFARLRREGRTTAAGEIDATESLDDRWAELTVVELDEVLAREASELAGTHPLRAADAIHLASAVGLSGGDPGAMTFACWDARLWDAAAGLGFRMAPGARPR